MADIDLMALQSLCCCNIKINTTPNEMMGRVISLEYCRGTLEIRTPPGSRLGRPHWVWDRRRHCWRAPAFEYAKIVEEFARSEISFRNDAGAFESLSLHYDNTGRTPRPYQEEALKAWIEGGRSGVVVLPTGAGKTLVAILAINECRCSTMVIAPTLDIVRQWHRLLERSFGIEVGLIGGGKYNLKPLTVCTYDSAHLRLDEWGNRYGLLIFDEVHHLPSPSFQLVAKCAIAPYRLGLTATPDERQQAPGSRLQAPARKEILSGARAPAHP